MLAGACASLAPGANPSAIPSFQPSAGTITSTPAPVTAAPLTPAPTLPQVAPAVVVVLADGSAPGTYTGAALPTCSHGVIGPDTWAIQYGDFGSTANTVATVQLTDEPDSTSPLDRIVSIVVTVGALFGGKTFILQSDRFSDEPFEYEVRDDNDSAVIHAHGKSMANPLGEAGVDVDVTINCPSIAGR